MNTENINKHKKESLSLMNNDLIMFIFRFLKLKEVLAVNNIKTKVIDVK